jgi:hypothetical protein
VRARDNPFAVDRVLAFRYRPQGWTWDELRSRLRELGYRAAIVGPHGSGKTTLLEDLEPRLAALGFRTRRLRLDRETPSFPAGYLDRELAGVGAADVILFDGAEQMNRLAWLRFRLRAARAGGLVVTSHTPGLLPTLVECTTTPHLLGEMVDTLIDDRCGEGGGEFRADLPELFGRHGGNLREAVRELYDRFATRTG